MVQNAPHLDFLAVNVAPEPVFNEYSHINDIYSAANEAIATTSYNFDTAYEFEEYMLSISEIDIQEAFNASRHLFPQLINNSEDLYYILSFAEPEDYAALYTDYQYRIQSLEDFAYLFKCGYIHTIYALYKDKLLSYITDYSNLPEILPALHGNAIDFCHAVHSKLGYNSSPEVLKQITDELPESQAMLIKNILIPNPPQQHKLAPKYVVKN